MPIGGAPAAVRVLLFGALCRPLLVEFMFVIGPPVGRVLPHGPQGRCVPPRGFVGLMWGFDVRNHVQYRVAFQHVLFYAMDWFNRSRCQCVLFAKLNANV